jgi:SNF2 family DNA or RNA helicase
MSKFITTAKPRLPQLKEEWIPDEIQLKTVELLLEQQCLGLLLDPGKGKTSIILAAHKKLRDAKLIRRSLVIAPLRPAWLVWPAEQKKWRQFEDIKLEILHGKNKEKALFSDADVCVMNPEGLEWLSKFDLKKLGFDMLDVDESTKFKNSNTKRFKLLRKLVSKFRRRTILTGDIRPKGLLDLFGQIYILDEGAALGQYITQYRNNYFYPSGYGGYDWKIQEGGEERILEKIRPITIRISAEGDGTLPEESPKIVEVELPPEARKIYDDMEEELISQINGGVIVAASTAVASGKLRQIANGGVYDEFGSYHFIHDCKAQAVFDRVEELNGMPALVAYEFSHDLERLRKVFGKDTPFIGGGVSTKRSLEIEREWNLGNIPVLLGQPASMGHGLNLQQSSNRVIWHSLTYNWEYYNQFNKRVRRRGNPFKQVYIDHIIAKGTVDEVIYKVCRQRGADQALFLGELYNHLGVKNNSTKSKKSLYKSGNNRDNGKEEENLPPAAPGRANQKESTMSEEKPNKFAAKSKVVVDVKAKKMTEAPIAKKASAKVTPVEKTAAERKEKIAKAEKAPKEKAAATAPRGAFAGKKIKVLSKDHGARDGSVRAALMGVILAGKSTDDVLGQKITVNGKENTVSSADIKFAVERGLIAVA